MSDNERILGSDAARAVGRFKPGGPDGYRAKSLPDGPLRATRAEAEADEREYLRSRDAAMTPTSGPAQGQVYATAVAALRKRCEQAVSTEQGVATDPVWMQQLVGYLAEEARVVLAYVAELEAGSA